MLDPSIAEKELEQLVDLSILKKVEYKFEVLDYRKKELSEDEVAVLGFSTRKHLIVDELKKERMLKVNGISISDILQSLKGKEVVRCVEERYEFKNSKISSGLKGVNRIFMPTSDVFPTLVASDTNDYVSLIDLRPTSHEDYKKQFLEKVYFAKNYRKITKEEACMIQGFPRGFKLPPSRSRWMKLIGNSVSVPVIDALIKSIVATEVFSEGKEASYNEALLLKSVEETIR
jgi:DNA (cytosine-5)-methyltransferase 1